MSAFKKETMKHSYIFSLLIFVFISVQSIGQNMPFYAQYNFNPFVLNPAMAGVESGHDINAGFRSQWTNFPTAPVNRMIAYTGQFAKNGLGFMAYNNKAGSLNYNGFQASYSYCLSLNEQSSLSIGLSMQLYNFQLRPNQNTLIDVDLTDPVVLDAINGTSTLESSVGVFYKNENGLYGGFSTPNIVERQVNGNSTVDNGNGTEFQLLGFVGYKINREKITIDPSIIIRKIGGTSPQVEMNLKTYFLDGLFLLGSYYRTGDNRLAFLGGIKLDNTYCLSYMHETSFNELNNYHRGSHTIVFGAKLHKK